MFNEIALRLMGWFLAWTTHKFMRLTEIEEIILLEFAGESQFYHPIQKPTILIWKNLQYLKEVYMVQECVRELEATPISFQVVSDKLKEGGGDVKRTRYLMEMIAIAVAQNGRNVVISGGFNSFIAEASIRRRAQTAGIRLVIQTA